MRFEIRASLDGMTLNGIDKLSRDEARSFATQDVDPLDEEQGRSLRQRRPSPPKRPGPPSPHPCRRPRTRWSIPRPLAWMRRHLLRLLPRQHPSDPALRPAVAAGRVRETGFDHRPPRFACTDRPPGRAGLRAGLQDAGVEPPGRTATCVIADAACAVFFIHPPGFLPHAGGPGHLLEVFIMSTIACDIPAPRWMNPRGGLSARRQPHKPPRVADCLTTTTSNASVRRSTRNSVDCPKNSAHRR